MTTEVSITNEPRDMVGRTWFAPVLERGTAFCAPNLETRLAFLQAGGFEFPLTVNEEEWDNSWFCSPWTHYISYAREEIDRAVAPPLSFAAGLILSGLGHWFRRAELNRVVMVNNWLHSTNPWPAWQGRELDSALAAMRDRWPDHALVFRSLNARECPDLLAALRVAGARLVPSRQVWYYAPDASEVAASEEFRKDVRLLERGDLEIVPHEALAAKDFDRLAELYTQLYIRKYSRHNPRYTADWLRHLHSQSLAQFTALRDAEGGFIGVEVCCELHGVLTSPIVGYDLGKPRSLGLYRRLAVVPLLEARRRGIPLNLSSGVGRFKALRGGKPEMEYLAVFDDHLPVTRRRPWRAIEELSTRLLAPYTVRHGL